MHTDIHAGRVWVHLQLQTESIWYLLLDMQQLKIMYQMHCKNLTATSPFNKKKKKPHHYRVPIVLNIFK